MKNFKIKIWENDGLDLKYRSLNHTEIQEVMNCIARKYDIPADQLCNSSLFIKMSDVLRIEMVLFDINEPDGFKELASKLNLDLPKDSLVDIIWEYNSIDQIEYGTLQDYWDSFWYGAGDEMCLLYFPDIHFLIMIAEYGIINM